MSDLEQRLSQAEALYKLTYHIGNGWQQSPVSRSQMKILDRAGALERGVCEEYNDLSWQLYGIDGFPLVKALAAGMGGTASLFAAFGCLTTALDSSYVSGADLGRIMGMSLAGALFGGVVVGAFGKNIDKAGHSRALKNIGRAYELMCALEQVATEGSETLTAAMERSHFDPKTMLTGRDVITVFDDAAQRARRFIQGYEAAKGIAKSYDDTMLDVRCAVEEKSTLTPREAAHYAALLRRIENRIPEQEKPEFQKLRDEIKAKARKQIEQPPKTCQPEQPRQMYEE